MNMLHCSASSLRAILCFIDPNNTPKIAFDTDDIKIIESLIGKLKDAVQDKDGTQSVILSFNTDNELDLELLRQFNGICGEIQNVISNLKFNSQQN